ncbi:hypothetical protein IF2G_00289 [Cordyceps javanica]|nr:hypothetical protein IF2G_00289 [Cordyceps javanica]
MMGWLMWSLIGCAARRALGKVAGNGGRARVPRTQTGRAAVEERKARAIEEGGWCE